MNEENNAEEVIFKNRMFINKKKLRKQLLKYKFNKVYRIYTYELIV